MPVLRRPRDTAQHAPGSAVVQTIIVSKDRARDGNEARAIARRVARHDPGPAEETGQSWRYRQRNPGDFRGRSFRTVQVSPGVALVVGRLRRDAPRENPYLVRFACRPDKDLERGYSYSMGSFGDESEAHAGLSGYSVSRWGLPGALEELDRRMGITRRTSGGCVGSRSGKRRPAYLAVFEGSVVGTGPDGEDLLRPSRLAAKIPTSRIRDLDAAEMELAKRGLTEASMAQANPSPDWTAFCARRGHRGAHVYDGPAGVATVRCRKTGASIRFVQGNPAEQSTRATAPRIVAVEEVIDTREYEEQGDRWVPIPGSGDLRVCSRCGREHEVHAHVLLSDGTRTIVGTGCAAKESMEIAAQVRRAEASAKTAVQKGRKAAVLAEKVRRLEAEIADAKRRNPEARRRAGYLLVPPVTVEESETNQYGVKHIRYRCGDAALEVTRPVSLMGDDRQERLWVQDEWRDRRAEELGWRPLRPLEAELHEARTALRRLSR